MTLPNIFDRQVSGKVIGRIDALKPEAHPAWGKMGVAQMLAHCNVTYELVYEQKHPRPNPFMRFVLKAFVKGIVTGPKPFKRNSQTAPAFLIKDSRSFEQEKARLIQYINRVQQEGEASFEQKPSVNFGPLSADQWNAMFYKHLDHHLTQFGV